MIGILSLAIIGLSFSTNYYLKKYKVEINNQSVLNNTIVEVKNENIKLITQIAKLDGELKSKDALIDQVSKYKDYLNVDSDLNDYLDQAKEISDGTPLDFNTSMILLSYAKKYNLKPSLILSMIDHESNFNQWEVGKAEDRGYMQIIPSTEKWLAEDYGNKIGIEYDPDKIFDPDYNIGLAAVYLNVLKKAYGSDYNRILSEYNRGPYGLAKYYNKNKTYETSYSKIILKNEKKYLAYNK